MPWWHVFFIFGAVRQDFTQIYGQIDVFSYFVRNWQWFCQMQCCAATAQAMHLTSVTGKTFFLEFACNLRSHCFGEGTRIEHFSDFGGFCSTFEVTRVDFGAGGRQNSHIYHGFCLLPGPRTPISESLVDKNQRFPPVFVYFRGRAPKFARNYQRCYKDYVKSWTTRS